MAKRKIQSSITLYTQFSPSIKAFRNSKNLDDLTTIPITNALSNEASQLSFDLLSNGDFDIIEALFKIYDKPNHVWTFHWGHSTTLELCSVLDDEKFNKFLTYVNDFGTTVDTFFWGVRPDDVFSHLITKTNKQRLVLFSKIVANKVLPATQYPTNFAHQFLIQLLKWHPDVFADCFDDICNNLPILKFFSSLHMNFDSLDFRCPIVQRFFQHGSIASYFFHNPNETFEPLLNFQLSVDSWPEYFVTDIK